MTFSFFVYGACFFVVNTPPALDSPDFNNLRPSPRLPGAFLLFLVRTCQALTNGKPCRLGFRAEMPAKAAAEPIAASSAAMTSFQQFSTANEDINAWANPIALP